MKVKTAKEHISSIVRVCEEIDAFDKKHGELSDETGFLCDAIAYLCDYRKVLELEIENAELRLQQI